MTAEGATVAPRAGVVDPATPADLWWVLLVTSIDALPAALPNGAGVSRRKAGA